MNEILFFIVVGLQIIAVLPSKYAKIKFQTFFPLLSARAREI
jgi:hypothetical protein